jgi:methanogenic corrinoid protein MtbC1
MEIRRMIEEICRQITEALVVGLEKQTLDLTRQALAQGLLPMDIIHQAFTPGLEIIGQENEAGLCFVPEMIVAGNIMQQAMPLLSGSMQQNSVPQPEPGTIVLGVVAGDIHTLGKDLVGTVLSLNGFRVVDLGVNVTAATFIDAVRAERPALVGLSALTRPAAQEQQNVIEALRQARLKKAVRVIIGGAAVSADWAVRIGADGYARDAVEAVTVCKQWVNL